MLLGVSQKRALMTGPLLLAAASCVPAHGLQPTIAAAAPAAAPPTAAAGALPTPEWAKLDPGMPYRVFEAAAAPARPFLAEARTEEDRLRSLDCLTQAIYYEAASESEDGQRAVAQVVLNRVRHPSYPNSVCGVVYQGSHLSTGCQFTFTCDGSLARRPAIYAWARARRIAAEALSGEVYAPVGNATHYHTTAIYPYWAPSLVRAAVVGAHVFYRFPGSGGSAAAFTERYAGVEPGGAELQAIAEQAPVEIAAAVAEMEHGVRKWRGATPEVRIHRGTPASAPAAPAPVATAAAEEPAASESLGIQIHRGSAAAPAS
jgi:spore germination cell wall hydrolase CwlJ-like protein